MLLERAGVVLVLADEREAPMVVNQLPRPYAVLAVMNVGTVAVEETAAVDCPAPAAEPPDVSVAALSPQNEPPVLEPLTDDSFERIRLPKDGDARHELIVELRDRQRVARMETTPISAAPPRAR
jgi:hypothetical protein